ncbi:glutamine-hydrolyzing carbamoyl-phosphate synthase small subunit [bacterium]|nr:glutamine-hydrolyzing carbamoyl-phosphate synthase small subunit [bacterium]
MAIAKLALENGLVFTGTAFGATGQRDGEVCFNTSMTGYQEILTDPSYYGQIVTMTYPLIGNYGINADDAESAKPWLSGFVCRELSRIVSNYRHTQKLEDFLAEHGIIGLQGVDTRAIVLATRSQGAMKGILSTTDLDDDSLVAKAKASPGLVGRDVAREVMPTETRSWSECNADEWRFLQGIQTSSHAKHVVAMDFGMKWNIARCLAETGCKVTVVPGSTPAAEIMAHRPDGVFISNGPGDPEPLTYAIDSIQQMLGKVPIFGICLGHQLIGQALGGKTFKLKFGHRGANQPVLNQLTGRVEITTQNHGFAVDPATLPDAVVPTHINLNDQTLEGLRHRDLPVFSVQYHPEASAGPHDSQYLFGDFVEMMDKHPVR